MSAHLPDEPRGQALVEFALVLTVFLILFFGIVDLGRTVFTYVTLAQATNAAVRTAIVDQDPSADCAVAPTSWECIAQENVRVLGESAVTFGIAYRAHDYVASDGQTAPEACSPVEIDCVAEVQGTTTVMPVTPVLNTFFPSGITISTTSKLPVERLHCTTCGG